MRLLRRKTTQKIISLNKRSGIAIVLCMTFLLGYMPFSTDKAYAADGSITLKVGRDIEYSSHHTHYFYAGDKESPVYCAQPQLPAPKSGKYSYDLIRPDSMPVSYTHLDVYKRQESIWISACRSIGK